MNTTRVLRLAGVSVVLAAAACSDTSDTGTGPNFAPAPPPVGLVCDFNAMKSSAGAYLGKPNAADALITTMKKQYGLASMASATDTGFDILALVATAHRTGTAVGTAVAGSKLTNDVIGCMTLTPAVTAPIDFSGSLGPSGAYEVRGGSADANAANVLTKDSKAVIAPPAGGFVGFVDTRVLFYSTPKTNTFLTELKVGTTGHSWNTIPERHDFNGTGTVAMCVAATDRDRIQEVDADGAKVLPLTPITDFSTLGLVCPTTVGAAPTGLFGRLAHLVKSAVMPTPAYAAAFGGGTGGLLGGLSDFGVVDVATVNLAIDSVMDSRTTETIPSFRVVATAGQGSLLPGVQVTIAVAGNQGSWMLGGTKTVTTDTLGVAVFDNLNLDKAGGYLFSATSSYTGFQTATVKLSNMFWIKQ